MIAFRLCRFVLRGLALGAWLAFLAAAGTALLAAAESGPTALANSAPVFVVGPTVTNALLQLDDLLVVSVSPPPFFQVQATDPDGDPVSYRWEFGDGEVSLLSTGVHAYAQCQPYSVRVAASDGTLSNTATLTVSVPCEFTIDKIQVKADFTKRGGDSVKLTAWLEMDPDLPKAGKRLILDVAGALVEFTLNDEGKVDNAFGKCRLRFDGAKGHWVLTATLTGGDWRDPWAEHGLTNSTTDKHGVGVGVPVVVVVEDQSFAHTEWLTYKARAGGSGQAK